MEDKWLELLKQGKCITERDVKILCEKVNINNYYRFLKKQRALTNITKLHFTISYFRIFV